MLKQKNILILTSKTGGGHVSLAEALGDLIEKETCRDEVSLRLDDRNTEHGQMEKAPAVTIVDPQPGFFQFHYRVVSRYALWLWAAEFQFFDRPGRALVAHRVFTSLVRRQLGDLLHKVLPDLIITTYPFLSYEVMRVLEQHSSSIPLVMLFSDANGVHAAWLSERQATATFAPTRETYEQALAVGFPPERVHLVGWPVRTQFTHTAIGEPHLVRGQGERTGDDEGQCIASRLALNLDPHRFTVFLQGGNEGAAHVNRTIENVLTASDLTSGPQVILATGTNRALLARYKNVPNLVALPYTKEIAPFMAAADVIMGKAGPNTLFESVMLGKPFIATTYIPGQEHANLSFIQRHGLGWVALQSEEQRALLTSLTHDTDRLRAMSASINTYRQWNAEANTRIVPLIRSLIG